MPTDRLRAAGLWIVGLAVVLGMGACEESLTSREPTGTLLVIFDVPGATDADFDSDDAYTVEVTDPEDRRFRRSEPARAPTTRISFREVQTGVWTVEVVEVPGRCPLDPAEENPTTVTVRESRSTDGPTFTVNCP